MWNSFDEDMMKRALAEAARAAAEGEVPVGAVLTRGQEVIAVARNQKEAQKSALGHAELLAIARASEISGGWRLTGCALYVTLEPCLMCAGAILHARLPTLIFGTRDPKFGAVKSLYESLEDARANHCVVVREGLFAEESRNLLKMFFSERRLVSRQSSQS